MKPVTRFLSLILALLMLVSLFACAENTPDDDNKETESATASVEEGSEAETADPRFVDELPSDYDGEKLQIKIVAWGVEGVSGELVAEGTNGDPVNDAVYERNKNVEERLNVTMNVTLVSDVMSTFENAVKGGDATVCDMVSNPTNYAIKSVQKGYYVNLKNDGSYIDTGKAYWTQGFNDIASFGTGVNEKQYLVTGAMAISLFKDMFVTVYNQDEFANKGIDDLYETVINGEWTLEKQEEILKDRHTSVIGDETQMGIDDFYGFTTSNGCPVDAYLVASDIEFIKKNDDGEWEYNGTAEVLERTDRLQEILGRIYYSDNGTYVFGSSYAVNDDSNYMDSMFVNGQVLMATVYLNAFENVIVNADFLYGIAPIPKLDATQKKYASYVQDAVTCYGISCTVDIDSKKFQTVTAFMEAAACESYNKVVDAYYNRNLSYKYMQTPESKVMLDLIYDSIKFDFVGSFSGVLSYCIRDNFRTLLTDTSSAKVSSTMAKQEKKIIKSLEKFNKAMNKINY